MIHLDSIEQAIAALAAGGPVVVVDDADRENEGDLIFAASAANTKLLATTMRLGGLICVAMPAARCTALKLPQMTAANQDAKGTAFTISVDARTGVTTGISAADRARTAQLLASADTTAADLIRPGHLFPLQAREGGVLVRRGHTEAAVDLVRLAGRGEVGVICEIANLDGSMARLPQLRQFADDHALPLVSIADLVAYRQASESRVEPVVSTQLPTDYGLFTAIGYRGTGRFAKLGDQIALVAGDPAALMGAQQVLVRLHSECLTGDVLASRRCDCGPQLHAALAQVADAGTGVVLYLRGHEGRGIGLIDKLRAYALQEAGHDTVDANLSLGLPADARDYSLAGQILHDLGVGSVRLLTNNPGKASALHELGVTITECIPLPTTVTRENLGYLRTKQERMGHHLPWIDGASA